MPRTRRIRKLSDSSPNGPDVRDLHFSHFGVAHNVHPMHRFEFVFDYWNSTPDPTLLDSISCPMLLQFMGHQCRILNLPAGQFSTFRAQGGPTASVRFRSVIDATAVLSSASRKMDTMWLSVNFDFLRKNTSFPGATRKVGIFQHKPV